MSEKPSSEFQSAFEWIPFYSELASALLPYREKQGELIQFLTDVRAGGGLSSITFEDRDASGSRFPLAGIDGFTFFGDFNRGISLDKRIAIVGKVKERFQIQAHAPVNFSGVPLVNNQSAWFFSFADKRKPEDIEGKCCEIGIEDEKRLARC